MAVGQSGAFGVFVMFRVQPDTTPGTDYVKIRRQKTLASTVKDLKAKWANVSTSLVQVSVVFYYMKSNYLSEIRLSLSLISSMVNRSLARKILKSRTGFTSVRKKLL